MPDYAAENMADSILSIAMAIASIPREQRLDGSLVASALLNLKFDGISGPVSFTEDGDRRDPRFTIFNLQPSSTGALWVDVGVAETRVGESRSNVLRWCWLWACCDSLGLVSYSSDNVDRPPLRHCCLYYPPSLCHVFVLSNETEEEETQGKYDRDAKTN